MTERHYAILEARGLLRAAGPDALDFLQGMISNDATKVGPERAIWLPRMLGQSTPSS